MIEWIRKKDPMIYCLPETQCGFKDTHRLKGKEWTKRFQTNGNQKKEKKKVLVSDQTLKMIKRHEGLIIQL